MAGFVFFDTETTGLRPGWDQIVHVAAIHTDPDLNEIDRFEAFSRLQPHVLPHPSALLANGLSIDQLTDPDRGSHYDMVMKTRDQFTRWSPAMFTGFNSIRFDEEMLRHALFQSLHPAYLTSYNNNARADVMTLALAAFASGAEGLVAPRDEAGRVTFKLERIAAANGVAHPRAHDAMSDVEATLGLCRMIRDVADEPWQRFVRFAKTATVREFVEDEDGFVLTRIKRGEAIHTPVVCLGGHDSDRNLRVCLDLRADLEALAALDDDALQAEFAAESSPIRRVRVNAGPAVGELCEAPASLAESVDLDVAEARARRIKDDPVFCRRLVGAHVAVWTRRLESPHVEDQLYSGGFPSPDNERRMADFHAASDRTECLEILSALDDPRLQAFASRLVHSERRSWLDKAERHAADLRLARRLTEESPGGALTLNAAMAEVDRLTADGMADPLGLLAEYRGWLAARAARVERFLAEHES